MVVAVVVLVETVAHHRLLQVYDLVLGLTDFAGCANLSVVRGGGGVGGGRRRRWRSWVPMVLSTIFTCVL